MKRNLSLTMLALVTAMLMPLAANCQVAPDSESAPTPRAEHTDKYEIMAGYGYTSLNQVNQSRNGLQGVAVSVTRDWGKYFGVTGDGGYYKYPYDSTNPGKPVVEMALFGPVVHVDLFGNWSGFIHVLLGVEHTGGENMNPDTSFAYGFGGGLDYKLNRRLYLRAYGDDVAASFSLAQNSPSLALSPHRTANPRAALGVVYKF